MQKVKTKSLKEVRKAKKEIGDQLLDELKGFIDRLEADRRARKANVAMKRINQTS